MYSFAYYYNALLVPKEKQFYAPLKHGLLSLQLAANARYCKMLLLRKQCPGFIYTYPSKD